LISKAPSIGEPGSRDPLSPQLAVVCDLMGKLEILIVTDESKEISKRQLESD